jgi:hypothetical protein
MHLQFASSVVGAQSTLYSVDHGLGYFATIGVAVPAVVFEAGARNVLERRIVVHWSSMAA